MSSVPVSNLVALAGLFQVLALIGCGSDDRPSAGGGEPAVISPDVLDPSSGEVAGCKAGSQRKCDHTWTSAAGTKHCTPSFQFCNASGDAWHPCGAFSVGPNGETMPPK